MIAPLSKPILSAKGTVASIITAEIAPAIRPKVRTVFLMEIQSPCINFVCCTPRFSCEAPELSSYLRVILHNLLKNHAFGGRQPRRPPEPARPRRGFRG